MKIIIPLFLGLSLIISLFFIKIQKEDNDEMLKSFLSLEVSLNNSTRNLKEKNIQILKDLNAQGKNNPELVYPYYKRAVEANNVSDDFITYIENLKLLVVEKSLLQNERQKKTEFLNDSNMRLEVKYFNLKKQKELKGKIDSVRIKLKNCLRNENGVKLYSNDTSEILSKPYFINNEIIKIMRPYSLAEVITFLSQLENECKNLEADILNVLLKNIPSICGLQFNTLEAVVIPNSNAVKIGTEYRAEVSLIATGMNSDCQIFVNGKKLEKEDGKGIFIAKPTSKGLYSWGGVIKIKLNGEMKEYPFKQEYQAF